MRTCLDRSIYMNRRFARVVQTTPRCCLHWKKLQIDASVRVYECIYDSLIKYTMDNISPKSTFAIFSDASTETRYIPMRGLGMFRDENDLSRFSSTTRWRASMILRGYLSAQ